MKMNEGRQLRQFLKDFSEKNWKFRIDFMLLSTKSSCVAKWSMSLPLQKYWFLNMAIQVAWMVISTTWISMMVIFTLSLRISTWMNNLGHLIDKSNFLCVDKRTSLVEIPVVEIKV